MKIRWHVKFKDGITITIDNAKSCSQAVAFAAYERARNGAMSYAELNAESVTKTVDTNTTND